MKINLMWIIVMLLILMMTTMVKMMKKNTTVKKEKLSQFECGFLNMNPAHIPFSFQFFLIAILFLIFDVEISMVLSYPMEKTSTKTLFMMVTFLTILIIGLIYEWQKSKIDWSE